MGIKYCFYIIFVESYILQGEKYLWYLRANVISLFFWDEQNMDNDSYCENLLSDIHKYSAIRKYVHFHCREKFGKFKLEMFYYTHFWHTFRNHWE